MACETCYPRILFDWVLRFRFVLSTEYILVFVSPPFLTQLQEGKGRERADGRYVVVTESWNYRGLTYFAATHSISITVFGIVAGVIMWGTKRFKVCPPPPYKRLKS
jgi:hypothetical protein